jgi:hypothetical protein
MTLRRQGAMGKRETRTQEALVAALRARPRTPYRADQCVLGAKASIFSSPLGRNTGMPHGQCLVRSGGSGLWRPPAAMLNWARAH